MGRPALFKITQLAHSNHEDRLTEALAWVLWLSGGTRKGFLQQIGIDREVAAKPWSIWTQFPVPFEGRRRKIDIAFERDDHEHVIWVEAKLDAELMQNQLLDYFRALAERCRKQQQKGTLVFLARPGQDQLEIEKLKIELGDELATAHVDLVPLNWLDVKNVMASQPEDPVAKRLQNAFNDYMNRIGATVEPLSPDDISPIKRYSGLRLALRDFLQQVDTATLDQVKTLGFVPVFTEETVLRPSTQWSGFPRWWSCAEIPEVQDRPGNRLRLEWNFDVRQTEIGTIGEGEPGFSWGLKLQEGDAWNQELEERMTSSSGGQQFSSEDDGDNRWLVATSSLEKVLDNGTGTKEQVKHISKAIAEGLTEAYRIAVEPN